MSQNVVDPWGYDYVRVRSNGNIAYEGFNGEIEFNVNNNESEKWISPKNSFLTIRLRIIQTDETASLLSIYGNGTDTCRERTEFRFDRVR